MTALTPAALAEQSKMQRQMRVQSLGAPLFNLVNEIRQAVELPPDLERRIDAINQFVKDDRQ